MRAQMAWLAGVALMLTTTAPPSQAVEGSQPAETRTRAADPQDAADPDPEPKLETEFVLVEASLPYVPSSNTIATKLPLPLLLTPANIGVVNAPLLAEQDGIVLSDALRNISGVNVQAQSGVQDHFVVRGFDSISGSLILTDGAPEPEASYYEMHNVERVELLKGPAGFLYGSNPLAGAVNIVRKQPLPTRLLSAGVTGGSFGRQEATLDLNVPVIDGFDVRLNGLWRESDNYRDDKDSSDWGLNPAFAWRLGDASTLNLNLDYLRLEREPDGGLPLQFLSPSGQIHDVPRRRSYQAPFDFSRQDVSRVQLDWETRLNDTVRLRDKVYYRGLDWDSAGTILNGAFADPNNPGAFNVSRTLTTLDDRQVVAGNQFEAIFSLGGDGVRHDLLTGVELTRHTDRFALDLAFLPDLDLFNPVETATSPPPTFPFERGDSTTTVAAPYIIDQITLNTRWQLLAGARLDFLDFEDDVSGTSRSESEVSPMLGAVFAPARTTSIYLSAGEAFAPPSPRVTGSPEPEESRQVELGLKKLFAGGRVQATWAVYHLERENIGIPDENGFTQQDGDQRSRGFEFELAAEPIPRLRTFFSYAFNDAELTRFAEQVIVGFGPGGPIFATVDRSGNDPAFAPRHLASFWVSRKFTNGLGIGGGGRFVDEQFIAEDNGFAMDSYTVFDAAIFYEVREAWRLKLHLKNITDEDYEVRGFPSTGVIPADPFSVFAGVEFRM